MTIAPISVEAWDAFAAERKHWEILSGPVAFLATDRSRYLSGPEFSNPMDVQYTAMQYPTREECAYFIGVHCMQAALTSTGILHEEIVK